MRLFLCLVLIAALIIDFCYTVVFWLVGLRPHRLRRYCAIVALLSVEAALIFTLVSYAVG